MSYTYDAGRSEGLQLMTKGPIAYTSYCPATIEILTDSAIIAYGLAAFSPGVKYLRVVDHTLIEREHETVKEPSDEAVPG